MHLGIVVPQQEIGHDAAAIAAWARAVEAAGFAYLDVFDHVVGGVDSHRHGPYTHEHEFHEPFVLYGFLAGQVDLDLSIGVMVLPQRQTALVAKQAAEVDILSGGRLRLGVGVGWNRVEYEALGADFSSRGRRIEEQVPVLRALWTRPVVEHAGEFDRIVGAAVVPRPVQRPIPIWMGGGPAPRVLERIGRLADGWIINDLRPDDIATPLQTIRHSAEAAGRDPAAIGVQGRIDIHGSYDDDRFARALDAWHAAGVDLLSIHAHGHGNVDDHRALLDVVARRCAPFLSPTTSSIR